MTYRTIPVDDKHPDVVALMRGPVMLVAVPDSFPKLPSDFAAVANHDGKPIDHIANCKANLMPFYRVKDEPYTTYLSRP